MSPPSPAPPLREGYPPDTANRRGLGLALLCLGLALLAAPSGCAGPSDPPPEGPAVITAFSGTDTVTLSRDDYRPSGRVYDGQGVLDPDGALALIRGDQRWILEHRLLWHTEGRANYAFSWTTEGPALPLRPGDNSLRLVAVGPDLPAGGLELAGTRVTLHPGVIIVAVVVWNLGVSSRRLDRRTASLALDRAPDTRIGDQADPDGWLHQRVDGIWEPCGVQFRLVGYQEPWTAQAVESEPLADPGSHRWPEAPCWQQPVVSNQSPWNESCFTERPACDPAGPQTQDFWDCEAQQENRCTLAELVRHSLESPGYGGPRVYQPGALNVYFAPQLDLREDLTLGIGCSGSRPLVVINDLWSDPSRLRLAHELGHALGIHRHIPDTVMGDPGQRTDRVSPTLCETVRAGAGAVAGVDPAAGAGDATGEAAGAGGSP